MRAENAQTRSDIYKIMFMLGVSKYDIDNSEHIDQTPQKAASYLGLNGFNKKLFGFVMNYPNCRMKPSRLGL